LPHVLNVNNKPPVTCYEAGYFVEAGFFDQRWQPGRGQVLRRIREAQPQGVRLIHCSEGQLADDVAQVRVVDAGGQPVAGARTTVLFEANRPRSASGVTDEQGWAHILAPSEASDFSIQNVAATGAVYEYTADDCVHCTWDVGHLLTARPEPLTCTVSEGRLARFSLSLRNLTTAALRVEVVPLSPRGHVYPRRLRLALGVAERRQLHFLWDSNGGAIGEVTIPLDIIVHSGSGRVQKCVQVCIEVLPQPRLPLVVLEVSPAGGPQGDPLEVSAEVFNAGAGDLKAQLDCAIVGANWDLGMQEVRLASGQQTTVRWRRESAALPVGVYRAVVSVRGVPGACNSAELTVF